MPNRVTLVVWGSKDGVASSLRALGPVESGDVALAPTVVDPAGSIAALNGAIYRLDSPVLLMLHESVRIDPTAISPWANSVAERRSAVVASLRVRGGSDADFANERWERAEELAYGARIPRRGLRAMRNLHRFRWEAVGVWRERHRWAGGFDERYESDSFIVGVDYAHRLRGSRARLAVSADVRGLLAQAPESALEREVRHASLFRQRHGELPAPGYWKYRERQGLVRLGRTRLTYLGPEEA